VSDPTTPAAGEGEADDDTGRAVDDETGVIRRGAEAAEDEPSEGEATAEPGTQGVPDPTTDDGENGEPGTGGDANGDDEDDDA